MEIKFRVRDLKTNEVIAYEFLDDQFSNGLVWNTEYVHGEIRGGVYPKDGVYREMYTGINNIAGNEIYQHDKAIWSGISTSGNAFKFTCKVVFCPEFNGWALAPIDNTDWGTVPIGTNGANLSEIEIVQTSLLNQNP